MVQKGSCYHYCKTLLNRIRIQVLPSKFWMARTYGKSAAPLLVHYFTTKNQNSNNINNNNSFITCTKARVEPFKKEAQL